MPEDEFDANGYRLVESFESKSSPGTFYEVKENRERKFSCNCPGWTMKRGAGERACKHTKAVAAKRGGA